jgi:hypothetical protein
MDRRCGNFLSFVGSRELLGKVLLKKYFSSNILSL